MFDAYGVCRLHTSMVQVLTECDSVVLVSCTPEDPTLLVGAGVDDDNTWSGQ